VQVTNPFAHLIQQARRTQVWQLGRRDGPKCCARLRRTKISLRHRIVLAAAGTRRACAASTPLAQLPEIAAALRMNLVLYKITVKRDLVLRHQGLGHAKAAVVMQRRSELSGKACWINQ